MRRILATSMLAAMVAVLLPSSATAGGSFLRPRERSYAWGEEAIAGERFSTPLPRYLHRRGIGTIDEGPFFAYLLREGEFLRPDKPIPAHGVPLGRIRFHRLPPESYCCLARLRFTVPQVPPGEYSIGYCNDPCTVNQVGFAGGSLLVGRTPLEARLLEALEHARFRMSTLRRDIRGQQGLRDRFQAAKARIGTLEQQLEDVRRVQAAPAAPVAEAPRTSEGTAAFAAGFGLVLGVVATSLAARRRRRRWTKLPLSPVSSADEAPDRRVDQPIGSGAPH